MTDNARTLFEHVRPPAAYLMLLVRAAVCDDGHGGPWLTVATTHTPAGTPVYTHHVSNNRIDWYSTRRLVLLSGAEALGWVMTNGWNDLAHPTVRELRALSDFAVELHGADVWARDYEVWREAYCNPTAVREREEHTEVAESAARSLRWTLAEQWLRKPATA